MFQTAFIMCPVAAWVRFYLYNCKPAVFCRPSSGSIWMGPSALCICRSCLWLQARMQHKGGNLLSPAQWRLWIAYRLKPLLVWLWSPGPVTSAATPMQLPS